MTLNVDLEESSAALAAEWDELASTLGASPFMFPGWIDAWRSSWGRGQAMCLSARRRGQLVGVLPLERKNGGLHSPTNWHTPEFGPIGADESVIRELLRSLFSTRARACSLGFVDEDDPSRSGWDEDARFAGYRPLTRVVQSSPFVETRVGWDAYEVTLGKKLRTELRRRRRRLEEEGNLRVELHSGDDDRDALLDEGFRIEGAAWKGSEGTAIASDAKTERFYRSVSRWAASKGWLQLAFLRLDEEALTFDLSFEVNGVHYLIKTGYEPARRKFAPGMLMRYEMIKRSFDLEHRSYEFLGSNNPWKLEWTDRVRNRLLMQAFSSSLTGRAEFAVYAHLRPRAKNLVAAARRRR